MSEPMTILSRTSPLTSTTRFRSRLGGDPKFFGFDSAEAIRKYNGNLPTGATTLYTVPNWKRAICRGLYTIHNPTAGAIAFDFHVVPSGGTVQTSNRVANITIAANATTTVVSTYLWFALREGDSLVINPGTLGLNAWGIFHEERSEAACFIGGAVNNITAATETTIITCPGTRTLLLAGVVGHNYNAGTSDVSGHARESGVAAGTSNQFFKQLTIASSGEFEGPAASYLQGNGGHIAIGEGGVISVLASVTNVNFWATAFLL